MYARTHTHTYRMGAAAYSMCTVPERVCSRGFVVYIRGCRIYCLNGHAYNISVLWRTGGLVQPKVGARVWELYYRCLMCASPPTSTFDDHYFIRMEPIISNQPNHICLLFISTLILTSKKKPRVHRVWRLQCSKFTNSFMFSICT